MCTIKGYCLTIRQARYLLEEQCAYLLSMMSVCTVSTRGLFDDPVLVKNGTLQAYYTRDYCVQETGEQIKRSLQEIGLADVYRRSTMTAEARALWQQHALSGIQLFKQQNVLSQYDTWYQQSVQQ